MDSDMGVPVTSNTLKNTVLKALHLVASVGIIIAVDKILEQGFVVMGIKFPSALFGMFCIFSILVFLDFNFPVAATNLMNFFEPALLFIQRWLPLFYVPALVVLPISVQDIPAASGLKICFIIVGGWLATLIVAGYTAIAVRKMVKTELIPAEPMSRPSPFSQSEVRVWTGIFLISFVAALIHPTLFGTHAITYLPFLLAATVLGYMVGCRLPSYLMKAIHPIISCVLFAEIAAVAFGFLSRVGYYNVLGSYLTKVPSNPGAGDILMALLNSVILSFAFAMYKQKKLVRRHATEIFTAVIISALFSLYSTALVGRLVGLERYLTVSSLPRCITVALALSIASLFEVADSSITAAVVVLTGLVGANFVKAVLDKLRFQDPIARGIATASRKLILHSYWVKVKTVKLNQDTMTITQDSNLPGSIVVSYSERCLVCYCCHGFGTAALSANEPEALPFCAIAYALTGISASLFCSVPAFRQSLLVVVG